MSDQAKGKNWQHQDLYQLSPCIPTCSPSQPRAPAYSSKSWAPDSTRYVINDQCKTFSLCLWKDGSKTSPTPLHELPPTPYTHTHTLTTLSAFMRPCLARFHERFETSHILLNKLDHRMERFSLSHFTSFSVAVTVPDKVRCRFCVSVDVPCNVNVDPIGAFRRTIGAPKRTEHGGAPRRGLGRSTAVLPHRLNAMPKSRTHSAHCLNTPVDWGAGAPVAIVMKTMMVI